MKKASKRVLQLDFAKKLRNPKTLLSSGDTSDADDVDTLNKCKNLLQKRGRKIVAFYSNPKLRTQIGMQFLSAIDLDMRYLLQTYSPFDVYLQPASMKEDIVRVLEMYKPEVVIWSGHTLKGELVVTTSKNIGETYATDELVTTIQNSKDTRLKLVCIMACQSGPICKRIAKETGIDAIGWDTIVEDHAAWIFSIKVFEYLLSHDGVDAHQVFEYAKEALEKCHTVGSKERCFTMGDPLTKTPVDNRWVSGIPRLYSAAA